MNRTLFVTGGAGFIGSNLVRLLLQETDWHVVNIDKLTYAGNTESLADIMRHPRHEFVERCIREPLSDLFASRKPAGILHLAAESHVDRSIDGPREFLLTNVVGTFELLQASLAYWRGLEAEHKDRFRFVHISTDEVFGSLGADGLFSEESRYEPNSPYSASKASSDHFVRAYYHTFGLPTVTTNCSNNYGPYQFPEKLIPLVTQNILEGKPIPVYGDGRQIRDWLYVEDHCRAILRAFEAGKPGEIYLVGGRSEQTNLHLVKTLCRLAEEMVPSLPIRPAENLIKFVTDRPGHDRRYAIDCTRIEQELGWRRRYDLDEGLRKTVRWYVDNQPWVQRVLDGTYRRERLGVLAT
jgi:dTDP-glucose 4,6-dehydratase